MNYCNKCGTALPDNSTFCHKCGNRMDVFGIQPPSQQPIISHTFSTPTPQELPANKCSVLATIFGSIGIVPLLNIFFLPPAIVLMLVGLFTCRRTKKNAVISSVVVVSIAIISAILFFNAARYW